MRASSERAHTLAHRLEEGVNVAVDDRNGLLVVLEREHLVVHELLVLVDEVLSDSERVLELDAGTLAGVERLEDVVLELAKVRGLPERSVVDLGAVAGFGLQGELARDRKDDRIGADDGLDVGAHELQYLGEMALLLEDVDLGERHDHLLAPLLDLVQELSLALAECSIDRRNKDHLGERITRRHE